MNNEDNLFNNDQLHEINTHQYESGYDYDSNKADRLTDANVYYDAWLKAKKNSDWKPKVQMFEMHWLQSISKIIHEVKDRTYMPSPPTQFITYERGKERSICGEQVCDRVVEHALNDEIVVPAIRKYLIYDNGASLKGKGIDFTRNRLVEHLTEFYHKYGNDGYILLIDYSKYYDNIRHDIILDELRKYVDDDTAMWILETIIDFFKVDVSYMTDDEYNNCMDTIFNSLDYVHINQNLLTGEKYMHKHLDIGNQTSQSAGILYPTPIDNFIKIVCSQKYYARYMDDSYCISNSKSELKDIFSKVLELADKNGIYINVNKSRIVKLSDSWRFLQIQYSLTDTGRVVRKINPRQVTVMKQKMKKLASIMTDKEFYEWVNSWIRSHRKYMSRKQYETIMQLYSNLRGKTICTK